MNLIRLWNRWPTGELNMKIEQGGLNAKPSLQTLCSLPVYSRSLLGRQGVALGEAEVKKVWNFWGRFEGGGSGG